MFNISTCKCKIVLLVALEGFNLVRRLYSFDKFHKCLHLYLMPLSKQQISTVLSSHINGKHNQVKHRPTSVIAYCLCHWKKKKQALSKLNFLRYNLWKFAPLIECICVHPLQKVTQDDTWDFLSCQRRPLFFTLNKSYSESSMCL